MTVEEAINLRLKKSLNNRKNHNQYPPLRYLEIGVHRGETITKVNNEIDSVEVIKEGVDPYGPFDDGSIKRMTSQVFFALNEYFWKKTYDVIYIDAMHFSPILTQEINESFKILNPYGTVVLDDTMPNKEQEGTVTAESFTNWSKTVSFPLFNNYNDNKTINYQYVQDFPGYPNALGDCWKSVVKIRMTRPDLKVGTLTNVMRPLTLICNNHGTQQPPLPLIKGEEINWKYYQENIEDIHCFNPNILTF